MSDNEFARALEEARPEDAGAATVPRRVIEEFCQGVAQFTDNRVNCRLVPGFATNLGQEWRVVMRAAGGGPEQVLLRAYIAPRGFPVQLDLYDEDLVECVDEDHLHQALLEFSRRETTAATLSGLAPE